MFSLIEYLTAKKKRKDLLARRNGFDWMAGELLRGEKTVNELEVIHKACIWRGADFDYGAFDAISAYRQLVRKPSHTHQPNYEGKLVYIEECTGMWSPIGVDRILRTVGELREMLRGL